MPFGFSKGQFDTIIAVFSQFPEIEEVVIFGSRAMGNFKRGSDVDLALKGEITERLLRKVLIQLNEEVPLPYIFEIIDYSKISSSNLKKHIDELGKCFYRK